MMGGCPLVSIGTGTGSDKDIPAALTLAIKEKQSTDGAPVRVVNMSFAGSEYHPWSEDEIRVALEKAHQNDLVLVAASGNSNVGKCYFPGKNHRTICVGGTDKDNRRYQLSNKGANYGDDLDVVAPCVKIPSTDALGEDGWSNDDYEYITGTSAATPLVSGLAALILSIRPKLSNVEVREIIERTCQKTGGYDYDVLKSHGSWNREVGYGLINAQQALAYP